jgi:hypothetical protein
MKSLLTDILDFAAMRAQGVSLNRESAHTPHTKAKRQARQAKQRHRQERNRRECNKRTQRRGR